MSAHHHRAHTTITWEQGTHHPSLGARKHGACEHTTTAWKQGTHHHRLGARKHGACEHTTIAWKQGTHHRRLGARTQGACEHTTTAHTPPQPGSKETRTPPPQHRALKQALAGFQYGIRGLSFDAGADG
eukprot:780008-Pelagomonas_calceolata.AAC.2